MPTRRGKGTLRHKSVANYHPPASAHDKKDCPHVRLVFGGAIAARRSAEVTAPPRRGDLTNQVEPNAPWKCFPVASFQGVCLVPVFLTGTCVCAWENSVENLQNSMDECQMRWNVSDVCERTGSLGKLRRPCASPEGRDPTSRHVSAPLFRSQVVFLPSLFIRWRI